MKNILFYSLLLFSLLQSCGSSSNVTSNFSIQKRKYTKGWNVKDLFQNKQTAEVAEAENTQFTSKKDTRKESETSIDSRSVDLTSSNENETTVTNESEVIRYAEVQLDNVNDEQTNSRLTSLEKVENHSDNVDPEVKTESPELTEFNKVHKINFILLVGSPLTLFISLFPLYILLIIQRFKLAKNVPMEERDEKYYRKKIFAGVFFILGTILLTIAIVMIIAVLILLFA